ncbi:MAG: cell wall-binding repeat-containing protein, partial [Coriobacteriales bacterium]|nr:cell wall-binding repeat-containing protein [Coriobacteriales bacterium]
GNKLWIKNFGGSKGDEFNSVVHASDGGFVTVGASSSVNGDLSQNKGATDFLVAKFDASGNKVWAKSYGGSGSVAVAGDDCLNSVVQAPDGGFVAVGSSGSSDGDLPGNKGYWDFIIAKFDANGNKVWIKNYGGSSGNGDFFYSVASTTDGGFVAVGNSNSSDGDLSGDASGVGLATIAKFDTNGNKVWLRKSGGRIGLSSPFFSVAQTSDGGFVAAGSANSSDENVHPIERGYGDFIIAKFDVNGNEIWLKGYWGQGYDSFASVIQTVDGSIVAVGSSSSSGGDLPDNKGDNDFIIAKFDSDGSLDPLTRHAGDVRTETAVQASRKTFPDASQVSTVIVAFSHNFPDALAASALAGATGAPLLLSATDSLDAVTLDELKRLSPSKVYIVGGEGVISDAVLSELQALPSTPQVSRLGGGDRYTTARLIAEEALRSGAPATEVFLATGKNFPDALAVSPFAAYKKVPVLLTEPGALSPDAKAFITANNVKEITIIGGEAVVSPEVFSELESLGVGVSRLFGDERYATARAATEALITQYGMSPTLVGIATGDNFPDALAGGVALGIRGGVMVLTPTGTLNANAEAVLSALKANLPDVEIFGGTAAVASEVETAVRQTLGF